MRKLTFVPLALLAAACSDDRCDPVLEAADCVRGETPMTARRYQSQGREGSSAPTTSLPAGPTAGSAEGGGPSAGSAEGGGPTAGPAEGSGPSPGSSGGSGPTAGSANAPDAYLGEAPASPCASFCNAIGQTCARELDNGGGAAQFRDACLGVCDCYLSAAPACSGEFLDTVRPCVKQSSCFQFTNCFDTTFGPDGVETGGLSKQCLGAVSAAQSDCLPELGF